LTVALVTVNVGVPRVAAVPEVGAAIDTVGGLKYPEPGVVTVIAVITPVALTVALATA
jgi:hypothetical protein